MSFDDLVLTLESENNAFEKTFNNCILFATASYNEYENSLKEAELKVIKESGYIDDLIALESEAKEGFFARAGKTIKKIIDSFIEWIGKIISAIKGFFTKKENKDVMDKAEKACKENPKLKKKQITIFDHEKVEKVSKKYEAEVDKKLSMFKAKRYSPDDEKDLDKINEEYEKELKTAKKATAVVMIGTALGMIAILINKMTKQESEAKSINVPEYETTDDPEDMEKVVDAYTIKFNINKEKTSALQNAINSIFNAIKGHFTHSQQIDPSLGEEEYNAANNEVKESTIDEELYIESILSDIENESEYQAYESTSDSYALEDYLNNLEKEIDELHTESTDNKYTDSYNNDDVNYVSVEEYLESMEKELFNNDDYFEEDSMTDYLKNLESEIFG